MTEDKSIATTWRCRRERAGKLALGTCRSYAAPGDHDVWQGRQDGASAKRSSKVRRGMLLSKCWNVWAQTTSVKLSRLVLLTGSVSQRSIGKGSDRSRATNSSTATLFPSASFCLVTRTSTTNTRIGRCSIRTVKGAAQLLPALDQPQMKDLGRNGTYLVIRQLVQDVRGFWQFADKAGSNPRKSVNDLQRAMVGRDLDGTPLVPLQQQPIEGVGRRKKIALTISLLSTPIRWV